MAAVEAFIQEPTITATAASAGQKAKDEATNMICVLERQLEDTNIAAADVEHACVSRRRRSCSGEPYAELGC